LSVMFCHFPVRTVRDAVPQLWPKKSDHSWRFQEDCYDVLHLSRHVEVQSEVKYMIKLRICVMYNYMHTTYSHLSTSVAPSH
jgi:hypothetical protein